MNWHRQSLLLFVLSVACRLALAAGEGAVATVKEVDALYTQDKKLCAEEADSGARMQCLRDAKAEHTKGIAAAKKAYPAGIASAAKQPACAGCGKVVDVQVVEKDGEGSALGLIGGGVAGALLGNQIGAGRGKTLATIAGAAGGAYAGKKVEEHVKSTTVWAVRVRFEGGQEGVYEFDHDPQYAAGDRVKKSGETIVRR